MRPCTCRPHTPSDTRLVSEQTAAPETPAAQVTERAGGLVLGDALGGRQPVDHALGVVLRCPTSAPETTTRQEAGLVAHHQPLGIATVTTFARLHVVQLVANVVVAHVCWRAGRRPRVNDQAPPVGSGTPRDVGDENSGRYPGTALPRSASAS